MEKINLKSYLDPQGGPEGCTILRFILSVPLEVFALRAEGDDYYLAKVDWSATLSGSDCSVVRRGLSDSSYAFILCPDNTILVWKQTGKEWYLSELDDELLNGVENVTDSYKYIIWDLQNDKSQQITINYGKKNQYMTYDDNNLKLLRSLFSSSLGIGLGDVLVDISNVEDENLQVVIYNNKVYIRRNDEIVAKISYEEAKKHMKKCLCVVLIKM